jgi:hypothetical protein
MPLIGDDRRTGPIEFARRDQLPRALLKRLLAVGLPSGRTFT